MEHLGEVLEGIGFQAAVEQWQEAALRAAALKLEAKQAFCEAYLASTGRNEAARTADAELQSHAAALAAEQARILAKAAEFRIEWALADHPARPNHGTWGHRAAG